MGRSLSTATVCRTASGARSAGQVTLTDGSVPSEKQRAVSVTSALTRCFGFQTRTQ